MTTNAALAAQVTSALTRWNDQLDQLADWLTGSPSGGPNGDGHYPLTNAEGETALFKSLPYVLDLVTGPADAASVAQAAAEAAETLAGHHKTAAELAQTQAELARDSAQNLRNETEQFRQDVAAYWAAVGSWQSQVSIDAAAAAQSEANALAHADDAIFARDEALVAQNAAQVARDEAQAYAASINPATLATKAELQTELDALVGAAPGTLDTLNEIAAALGDDPNFATTMTNSLAGKADIGHSHVIADVTGLQTALDGKQAVGSYASATHNHVTADITDLSSYTGFDARYYTEAEVDALLDLSGSTIAGTGSTALTITNDSTVNPTLLLESAVNSSDAAPILEFQRDNATPAAGNYLGQLKFKGKNSTGGDEVYAKITAKTSDVTTGSEDGLIEFMTKAQGANLISMRLTNTELKVMNGHDLSVDSGNLYVGGTNVITAINGKANSSHTHIIGDVTGLQTALDGKQAAGSYAAASHTHTTSQITNLSSYTGFDARYYTESEADGRFYRYLGEMGNAVNLDNLTTTGRWHQAANAEANGTGYPIGRAGLLQVFGDGYKYQTYQTYDGNESYFRTYYTSWSSWKRLLHSGNYNSFSPTLTGGGASGTWGISITGSSASTTGNAATATKLATARNIALSGDVTGSANFDGSGNISITATVADDSHNHTYDNIDGLTTNGWGGPRITTGSGYIDFGPANTSHAHIYTDRPTFYFNKELRVNGQKVFHDAYHPNADKLTTARTINGVAFDGTANITVADSTKLPLSGGTVTGSTTFSGTTTHNNGLVLGTGGRVTCAAQPSRDKLRVWNSGTYTIGMTNGFTFGGIVGEYAMTFQMNDQATRGFWWGDNAHTGSQGAMALTTNGKLTVADSIRVGYGESDTTVPDGVTYDLDVSGKAKINGGCAVSHGGSYSSGKITVSTSAPSGGSNGDIWLQV